jgi:diacylglycerol kinase family enzyme
MMRERGITSILAGRELPILLNARARGAHLLHRSALLERFSRAGVAARLLPLEPRALKPALMHELDGGAPAVGVAGGDGSISSAAALLPGSEVVLVPVPLGTHNHFARRYGLASIEAVARALRAGTVECVPVGELNGNVFVNNASCGAYAHLVRQRERLRPWVASGPAVVLAALWVAARRPLLALDLELNGEHLQRRTAALWVGIGRNSLRLPEPGAFNSGVLELVLPRPDQRRALLALAYRLWRQVRTQQVARDAQLETMCAHAFTVRSQRPIPVAMDGEVMRWSSPLHFRYRPHALRVLALFAPPAA